MSIFLDEVELYLNRAAMTDTSEAEYNVVLDAIHLYIEQKIKTHGFSMKHREKLMYCLRDKVRAGEITVQQAQQMTTKSCQARMD